LAAAALLPLALFAITRIGPDRVVVSPPSEIVEMKGWRAPFALLRDRRILVFAAGLMLFQLSSIAVLQLAAVEVTARVGARSGLVIAAFIIVPQAIVALAAPWIGAMAEQHGRRIILIAGFATTPLRALGFMLIGNPVALIGVQVLEGVGGEAFGVMMPLVAADLTRGTRHYTLCLGLLSLAATAGAALSTVLAGLVADRMGRPAAFFVLAVAGLLATALIAIAFPETRAPALAISPGRRDAGEQTPPPGT
jgi:MFS family permease